MEPMPRFVVTASQTSPGDLLTLVSPTSSLPIPWISASDLTFWFGKVRCAPTRAYSGVEWSWLGSRH